MGRRKRNDTVMSWPGSGDVKRRSGIDEGEKRSEVVSQGKRQVLEELK